MYPFYLGIDLNYKMHFNGESPFLVQNGCSAGATGMIRGGNNGQYGQNYTDFVHSVDTMDAVICCGQA